MADLGYYEYGFRIYDPSTARFSSRDRFSEKFAYQSVYVYAGNNPILNIDINGDSLANPQAWSNVVFGLGTVVGSGYYMVQSAGVGAAFGGPAAMAFGFGQISMGIAQFAEVDDPAYQNSNNLVGYTARKNGANEEDAKVIDSFASFIPSIITGQLFINPRTLLGSVDAADKVVSSISLMNSILGHSSNEMTNRNQNSTIGFLESETEENGQDSNTYTITDPNEIEKVVNFINSLPQQE